MKTEFNCCHERCTPAMLALNAATSGMTVGIVVTHRANPGAPVRSPRGITISFSIFSVASAPVHCSGNAHPASHTCKEAAIQ